MGFVSLYAATERGLPESMAGVFTSWMLGAQVIATPIWGMIGDRYGHKSALQFGLLSRGFDDEPPKGSLRLWTARGQYGLPHYPAHQALTDALACAELYLAQTAELRDRGVATLRDLRTA